MGTNLTAILDDRADKHPERLLYAFYGGDGVLRESYSYAAFARRSRVIAGKLRELNVSRGDVVLLVYPPGIDVMLAFFACARIGAIPAPAPSPILSRRHPSWTRLAHIAEQAGAACILSTSAVIARLGGEGCQSVGPVDIDLGANLGWIATDMLVSERDSVDETPSEILFLQYTSGSTSLPRGIAVSHENVVHNAGLTADHAAPVYVSWLPHFHDLGLVGCLLACPVKGGTTHCFSPLDFMRRPILWLQLISNERATITAAPNAAYEYCLREDKIDEARLHGVNLGSLRTMANCAEPIRPETFRRFSERFGRYGLQQSVYIGGYGLAEHTLCVTTGGRRVFRPAEMQRSRGGTALPPALASSGYPPRDVTLRIVNPQTRHQVADGEIGEIWVDSPSKAAGYWRLPNLTKKRFAAKLAGDPDGREYLRTGDLGFLDDGELFVCGRLGDMIVCNGRNIFPNDIEALSERALPALVGHVAAFGVYDERSATEALVVLVEAAEGVVDLHQLGDLIQGGSEVTIDAIGRVPRGTIVRTSSGKIARQHCRTKWQRGEVELLELVRPGEDAFETETLEALIDGLVERAASLGNPDATLEQLGLDSIALVNLSLQLEELLKAQGLDWPEMMDRVADLSLLQAMRLSDLRNGVFQPTASPTDIAALSKVLDDAAHSVRKQEQAQMRADAALDLPDPRPAAGECGGGGILITGATGFLGAFLARALMELTAAPITALIRCDSPEHGAARMRRALIDADMAPDAVTSALASRLRIIPGDISRPQCGLSGEAWNALAREVGTIYHCAAEVDYVKSYGLLRGANVLGTREIIRLACERHGKTLHHVSTTFVHGWSTQRTVYESDVDQPLENLDFGYAQSKWVAEQLVLRARRNGLPATIYRPSLVTASMSGRFVTHDIVARILGYMIRHGLTADAANQVSFLPVDICARNIVAISQAPALAEILHMTVDDYYRISEVCAAASDLFGYRFSVVSLEEFVRHAHAHCTESDPLYPLLSFLDRNTGRILRMGDKRYDNRDYQRARAQTPMAVSHPDLHETVDPIVRYLISHELVPAAPGPAMAATVSMQAAE